MIRNAPGPLKGVRAMTADFIEGLIDVIRPPKDLDQFSPSSKPAPAVVDPLPTSRNAVEIQQPNPEDQPAATSAPQPGEAAPPDGTPSAELRPAPASGFDAKGAFSLAIKKTDWIKRQDFKVLAIFWEARQREMGPITAKIASVLGDEIGLKIRHENIRKVVRTRLNDFIETATVEESQPPTFQYQMTASGERRFSKEYLEIL